MKKIIFVSILLLTLQCIKAQTSYFVDAATGNDANSGNSLTTAWKTIQKAFDNATVGSIVFIKAGTYKQQLTLNVSGTLASPIEFRNYQSDSVYIDGTGLSANPMIDIADKSNIIFRNLIIQNLVKNNAVGIQVVCSGSGNVDNLTFKNIIIRNINWTANPNTKPSSSKNSQPFIAYGQGTSTAHTMTNILVDSCHLYNNITGFSESLSFGGNISGITITNNLVHDNTNIGIDVTGNYNECQCNDTAIDHSRNVYIAKNICYNNISNYATSGGIYVDGGVNVLIEKNITHGNGYGIELGCEQSGTSYNLVVRDNLIYNNQATGMAIGGYDTSTTGIVINALVTNNTFIANNYSKDGSGEIDLTKVSGCVIKNNIFYTNAQNRLFTKEVIIPQTGLIFDYNDWFTPNNDSTNVSVYWGPATLTGFTSYKTTTGFDTHSIYANPQLNNAAIAAPNAHLLITSPCINRGDPAYVLGNNETDLAGKSRVVNNIIDMGAYEFDPTAVPVKLLYFNAVKQHETILISWATATQINNDYFEIERSVDGKNFETINMQTGNNANQQREYQFIDARPLSVTSYYRLKQVDFSGLITYSSIVKIQDGSSKLLFNAFVSNHQLTLVNDGVKTVGTLYNNAGQSFKQFSIIPGQNSVSIPSNLEGVFYLNVGDYTYKLFIGK